MAEITKVCIGIQARSNSKRFPKKVFETIDGKPILQHVIDSCNRAAMYMNRHTTKNKLMVTVGVLVPKGDEIVNSFRKVRVYEGPEHDVLTRYKIMAERLWADYVVRITADCPLIPPYLITKHINTAVMNRFDYCSNVDERARTAVCGFDVEVISRRAIHWLDENAKEPSLREHVTQLLRSDKIPQDFTVGHIVGYLNQSHLKFSVDTPDDLERVRAEYDRVKLALEAAEKAHGKASIHRS